MRPKNFLLWIVIVAAILIAGKWSGQFDTLARLCRPSVRRSRAARKSSGNSLEIAGERIRLFGIDAPEGRQQCRDAKGADYACGREAARALERADRRAHRHVHDEDARPVSARCRDLRGRRTRPRRRDGAFRPARDYARHSRGRYAAAEREAREGKRGLWAGEFETRASGASGRGSAAAGCRPFRVARPGLALGSPGASLSLKVGSSKPLRNDRASTTETARWTFDRR